MYVANATVISRGTLTIEQYHKVTTETHFLLQLTPLYSALRIKEKKKTISFRYGGF